MGHRVNDIGRKTVARRDKGHFLKSAGNIVENMRQRHAT